MHNGLPGIGLRLDELVRRGARQVIEQAIEAELAERDIVTAAGPVTVEVLKVRHRSGTGVKFNSLTRHNR